MMKKFDNVEYDKRVKVINSGFAEFADYGVKRSSLNRILAASEVSKGFFYHYFKNKEELLLYLVEYAIQIVLVKLNRKNLLEVRDYIHRLQLGAIYKTEIAIDYPRMFDFLTMYSRAITIEKYMVMAQRMSGDFIPRMLTENIDYSLFRDDLKQDVALKVTNKYIAQVSAELSAHVDDWSLEQMIDYYDSELEDLKKVVYKRGDTNE
jgi:AcrR family transcriptional regulator